MYIDLFLVKDGPKGLFPCCQDSDQSSIYWLLIAEAQKLDRPVGVLWIYLPSKCSCPKVNSLPCHLNVVEFL